jgi:heme/copper-type cytochrome/quinol oxidase subunit 4
MNKHIPAKQDVDGEGLIYVICLTVISEMLALIGAVLFKLINPNLLIICSALTGVFIFFIFMQLKKSEDEKMRSHEADAR